MKVGYKLTSAFLIFTVLTTALFYIVGLRNQKKNSTEVAMGQLHNVADQFFNLEERDTKILFSTLEVIVRDSNLKKVYLEKDREKLYRYEEPLFKELKSKYGITHLYFILPDGRVFLRVHDKQLFGDPVKRISFIKARDTRQPAWEIELGKTAFALRTVMPYYYDNKLIGYVELAEGIDHFLGILKNQSRSEFAIIADKAFLDRGEWKSMRQREGLRDNWDDMTKHILVGSTGEGKKEAGCFNETNLELVERGENIFKQIRSGEHDYMCSGFNLEDAEGRHIGAVLSLIDITGAVQFAKKANNAILHAAMILFVVTFTAGIIISRSLTKPILKLKSAAEQIGKGNLNVDMEVSSRDEIRGLAESFQKMAHDLRRHEAELQSAYKDMENYSTAVSHDLKAPVRRIEGFSDILLKDYADRLDEHGKDILRRTVANTEKMKQLIEDLLHFSRVSATEIKRSEIDMEELARGVYEELKAGAGERKIQFEVKSLPPACGDPVLIHQVFFNLLSNAVKFTRTKETAIIEVSGNSEKDENIYNVKDNGIGFDMRFADKLFGLFQRIQTEKTFEGTGVGLVIVRKIVEKHGGRVWAEGRPGEGASFYFSLPRKI